MQIQNVALVIRKTEGGVLIFGKGLEIPLEIMDDQDYLVLGSINIEAKHIFHEYKLDAGNTPDKMIRDGKGLDHRNYKMKVK